MINAFQSLSPVMQTLLATIFTWGVTALGAASFFSLISPAIEMANNLGMTSWLIVAIGFLAGGLLLFVGDKIYELIQKKYGKNKNTNHSIKRCLMLISSITLHNIPEGLAIGVAFGSLAYNLNGTTLAAAMTLALGIGLQNFPEGSAVSLPLRREGFSRKKAFFYGQLSGIVEPISAVIGAILVLRIQTLLPFLLAFAAGAMIYVVIEELIPESQANQKKDLMAFFTLFGFTLMMVLDVALG